MNLAAIRQEILNHGFDSAYFPPARLNAYVNDGYAQIARRVQYYTDEATYAISTVTGTSTYPLPAGWGKVRSLFDTQRDVEMTAVSLREIDRSSITKGAPLYYALDGANVHLYPPPDNVYPLELRYWAMPAPLVNDTDSPTLPADYHNILWAYGCWMCYEAEDDAQQAQYFEARFEKQLAEFTSDARFPSSDLPTQLASMWEQGNQLGSAGWALWVQ